MAHRMQITLSDEQYARLRRRSEDSGAPVAELVRRAVDHALPEPGAQNWRSVLDRTGGAWKGLDVEGAGYVDQLRRGTAGRLAP